jgi:hypothetical protein
MRDKLESSATHHLQEKYDGTDQWPQCPLCRSLSSSVASAVARVAPSRAVPTAQWPDYVVINRRRNFTFDRARRELLGILADVLGDVARGGHTVKPGGVGKSEALQMPASFSTSICAMRRLRKPLLITGKCLLGRRRRRASASPPSQDDE